MFSFFTRSERVIIVDDDRVRSVVIGPTQRLRPTFIIAGVSACLAVALGGWGLTALELGKSQAIIGHVQAGSESLSRQLEETRGQLAALAGELDGVRGSVAAARAADAEALARVEAALAALDRAGEGEAAARVLRQAVTTARQELAQLRDAGPNAALAGVAESLDGMTLAGRALADGPAPATPASADAQVAAAGNASAADVHAVTSGLARALAEAQAETQRMAAAMAAAEAERDAAIAAKAEADRRMASVEEGQIALLTRLTEHAELRIGTTEASLRETGLDLDRILAELEATRFGQGGPLVELPELPPDAIPPVATQAMAQLEGKLERQARLRALYNLLPLSAPIDDFYVSSGFGKRRDPFTRTWAMHTGVDLVSQYRAPVAATAPGTVTRTGWEEGYGRMVEVDHGFGIRTRYAHLDQISVKAGAQVDYGQQVGTLGNTGRSTGPHVHYEVLVDGRPVDPLRFMEKGRYVCEG